MVNLGPYFGCVERGDFLIHVLYLVFVYAIQEFFTLLSIFAVDAVGGLHVFGRNVLPE